jgi:hypothetical protein
MAVKAFREAFVTADALVEGEFGDFAARQTRYEVLWAAYENTAYRNIHPWAQGYRNQYGLYRYIRSIYSPAYRLGEFWKAMLWGGELDAEAGEAGALPIATDNERLRPAIAQLWRDSGWQVNKDIATLWGPVLGDVALYIRDDTERQNVRLEVLHPGVIKDVTLDAMGNVKGYELEETRTLNGKDVTYTEIVTHPAGEMAVNYRTLVNGREYAWNGEASAWSVPYGFVPLVMIQHNNTGQDWGWSEIHPGRSKFQEADDLASKLHDQIRKSIDPVWLFAGVSRGASTPQTTGSAATTDRPQPGREEMPALYGPAEAKATPLIADVKIAEVAGALDNLLQEIERDYPELQMDIWSASGDTSGRALRTARQRAETKVKQRRPNYDNALVRAQQMAVAIGGMRQYPGYEGFGLDSYEAGALDHAIAKRPVFQVDPLDDYETRKAFWETVAAAQNAGASLEAALLDMGWEQERVDKFVQSSYGEMEQ